jgi:hypothetical protein
MGAGRALMTFGSRRVFGGRGGHLPAGRDDRYARSDAFNPKGEVKCLAAGNNGWQETVKAGDGGGVADFAVWLRRSSTWRAPWHGRN